MACTCTIRNKPIRSTNIILRPIGAKPANWTSEEQLQYSSKATNQGPLKIIRPIEISFLLIGRVKSSLQGKMLTQTIRILRKFQVPTCRLDEWRAACQVQCGIEPPPRRLVLCPCPENKTKFNNNNLLCLKQWFRSGSRWIRNSLGKEILFCFEPCIDRIRILLFMTKQ